MLPQATRVAVTQNGSTAYVLTITQRRHDSGSCGKMPVDSRQEAGDSFPLLCLVGSARRALPTRLKKGSTMLPQAILALDKRSNHSEEKMRVA